MGQISNIDHDEFEEIDSDNEFVQINGSSDEENHQDFLTDAWSKTVITPSPKKLESEKHAGKPPIARRRERLNSLDDISDKDETTFPPEANKRKLQAKKQTGTTELKPAFPVKDIRNVGRTDQLIEDYQKYNLGTPISIAADFIDPNSPIPEYSPSPSPTVARPITRPAAHQVMKSDRYP